MSVFRVCPKRYEYKYIQGRVPVHDDSEAMAFGRLWDDATGVLWAEGGDLSKVVAWLTSNAENINPLDAVKVAVLLEHYDPPIGKYEFVGNQQPVTFEVDTAEGPVPILTKSDTLLREKTKRKRLIVREAKTTTFDIDGDSPYWQTLQINTQVAAYWKSHKAAGVLYDVIKRPTLLVCDKDAREAANTKLDDGWNKGMTKKAQAELLKSIVDQVTDEEKLAAYQVRLSEHVASKPSAYFQFRAIFKTKADLERDSVNLSMQAELVALARVNGTYPMYEHSCITGFMGRCPYLDVCTNKAALSDSSMFADVPHRSKPF